MLTLTDMPINAPDQKVNERRRCADGGQRAVLLSNFPTTMTSAALNTAAKCPSAQVIGKDDRWQWPPSVITIGNLLS